MLNQFMDDSNKLVSVKPSSPLPVSIPSGVALGGSSATSAAIVPKVVQGANGLVIKASAGNFYGGTVVAGATAGLLVAYNATAVPSAGAALDPAKVLGVAPVAANGAASLGEYGIPDRFDAGVVLIFTTALANNTAPANAAVFLRGRAV